MNQERVDNYTLQEIVAVIVLRLFVVNLTQLIRMVESSGSQIDSLTDSNRPPPNALIIQMFDVVVLLLLFLITGLFR